MNFNSDVSEIAGRTYTRNPFALWFDLPTINIYKLIGISMDLLTPTNSFGNRILNTWLPLCFVDFVQNTTVICNLIKLGLHIYTLILGFIKIKTYDLK